MGKFNVSLPDDLEARLRRHAKETYGGRKGALSAVIARALKRFLDEEERDAERRTK